MIDLDDSCVVARSADKLRLHPVSLTAYGAIGGALWGTLIGLIVLNPPLGLATGAIAGAIVGNLTDYGINDQFVRELAWKLGPRSSAIFMLMRRATVDKVQPVPGEFAHYAATGV